MRNCPVSNYFTFAYDGVSVTIPFGVDCDLKEKIMLKSLKEKKADFGHFNCLNLWSINAEL